MRYLEEKELLLVNDTILSIYSIADLEVMRKSFLESLRRLIPYDKAMFDFGCRHNNEVEFFNPVAVNFDEEKLSQYFDYYEPLDYTRWVFTQSKALVYRDTDLIDSCIREETEIFRDWMAPMDAYFTEGASIVNSGILFGSVTLFRPKCDGNFSEKDLLILNLLNTHLSNRLIQVYPNGVEKKYLSGKKHDIIEKYNFTEREKEVTKLVLKGLTNIEISNALFISESTVKKHLNNVFNKMQIKSRTQLMKILIDTHFDTN